MKTAVLLSAVIIANAIMRVEGVEITTDISIARLVIIIPVLIVELIEWINGKSKP